MPSNKKKNKTESSSTKKTQYRHPNDLPRPKIYKPEAWLEQVNRLHPRNDDGLWFFPDGDYYIRESDDKNKLPPVAGDCPVCLENLATKTCARCHSVSYCSAECQKKHWKESHKKACGPNPKLYVIKLQLEPLVALPAIYHDPHEFLLIKPTEAMASLEDICANVLESADHIMEIPGFGWDQIQTLWPFQNTSHPLQKRICREFGWTSGVYGVELVEGYRVAEDICVYMVLNDDSFTSVTASPGLANSYYGGSIYPSHVREGNLVRGNIVIYKLMAKKKQWRPLQQLSALNALLMQVGDDSGMSCEYEMYPMSKLEIALLLHERRKALAEGAFTRRMWRAKIRREEREIENNNGPPTISF